MVCSFRSSTVAEPKGKEPIRIDLDEISSTYNTVRVVENSTYLIISFPYTTCLSCHVMSCQLGSVVFVSPSMCMHGCDPARTDTIPVSWHVMCVLTALLVLLFGLVYCHVLYCSVLCPLLRMNERIWNTIHTLSLSRKTSRSCVVSVTRNIQHHLLLRLRVDRDNKKRENNKHNIIIFLRYSFIPPF